MPSGNVGHLEREGPTPPDRLPFDLHRGDRENGLHLLTLHGGRGSADALGKRLTRIAYLSSHDRETVLRAFLAANPHLTEQKTRRGLTQQFRDHGREWGEVASSVLGEFYEGGGPRGRKQAAGETDDCPFCSATVPKGSLPDHLASECSG